MVVLVDEFFGLAAFEGYLGAKLPMTLLTYLPYELWTTRHDPITGPHRVFPIIAVEPVGHRDVSTTISLYKGDAKVTKDFGRVLIRARHLGLVFLPDFRVRDDEREVGERERTAFVFRSVFAISWITLYDLGDLMRGNRGTVKLPKGDNIAKPVNSMNKETGRIAPSVIVRTIKTAIDWIKRRNNNGTILSPNLPPGEKERTPHGPVLDFHLLFPSGVVHPLGVCA